MGEQLQSTPDCPLSTSISSRHEINLFAISDSGELLQICEIPSVPVRTNPDTFHPQIMRPMKPMTLSGHVIAMSDDTASTVIYNWKTGAFAVLEHEEDEAGVWKVCLLFHIHLEQVLNYRLYSAARPCHSGRFCVQEHSCCTSEIPSLISRTKTAFIFLFAYKQRRFVNRIARIHFISKSHFRLGG